MAGAEHGFEIESLQMRRAAGLEKVDHPLRFRRVVQRVEHTGLRCGAGFRAEQFRHRERAEAEADFAEEMPARGAHEVVVGGLHSGQRLVMTASEVSSVEQTMVRAASGGFSSPHTALAAGWSAV